MRVIFMQVLLSASLFFSFQQLESQGIPDSASHMTSYAEAAINYLSNNVYLGRSDSIRVPYITPTITYYHKSGLFISGSLSYLNSSSESRVDLFDLELGYYFSVKQLAGGLSVSKDFYNSQSYNVNAETKGSLNGFLAYDLGFIKPTIQGTAIFNSKVDYGIGLGAEHSFFAANDHFKITPSFLMNASTQNYYSDYYTKRRYSAKRQKRTGNGNATVTTYLPNASEFKVMDYELGLPFKYALGDFILSFSPTYVIPVNPTIIVRTVTPVIGNSHTTSSTQKLNNTFFWSAGVSYSF